jgi:hypothetical protein
MLLIPASPSPTCPNKVPELWLKRSFPSLKPLGPYVKEVIERCDFFRSWLDDGPPVVYWLSGFFFTQVMMPRQPLLPANVHSSSTSQHTHTHSHTHTHRK